MGGNGHMTLYKYNYPKKYKWLTAVCSIIYIALLLVLYYFKNSQYLTKIYTDKWFDKNTDSIIKTIINTFILLSVLLFW